MILELENDIGRILNVKSKTHQLLQKASFRKTAFCLSWETNTELERIQKERKVEGEKANDNLLD